MGSLVGGWDSPVHHPEYKRNNSLTKEEIDAYWRSNKKKAQDDQNDEQHLESYSHRRRSNSLPTATDTDKAAAGEQESPTSSWEELIDNKPKGWWRRSNWAFLNEPPAFEGTTRGYSSQFHVANFEHDKDSSASAFVP